MPTITVTDEQMAAIEAAGITDKTEPLDSLDGLLGTNVLIRTVTHYWTGNITARVGGFLQLTDAAWIADTGRFADALATGKLDDVEPVADGFAMVSIGAIIDITNWNHALPREQK